MNSELNLLMDKINTEYSTRGFLIWVKTYMNVCYTVSNKLTRLKAPNYFKYCQDPDLNWRHEDFQSTALPTELSRLSYLYTIS